MQPVQSEKINSFLVNAFNTILQLEDRALSSSHEFSNLSVREFHVIETVIACGEDSSMSTISQRLGITVGSLTVAVKNADSKRVSPSEKRIGDMRRVYGAPDRAGTGRQRVSLGVPPQDGGRPAGKAPSGGT